MSNTLEQIIADLEKTAAPAQPVQEAEKVAETSTPTQDANEIDGLRKFAADLYAQGQVMAQGFMDQLNKVAVGPAVMTPNTAQVPANPAVQVATQDVRLEDVSKVEGIIKKLTMGGENKMDPSGAIHVQNSPADSTQPVAVDETPVAADVKQANAEIIEALYQKYFA